MTLNVIKSSFKAGENKTVCVITRLFRVYRLAYRSIRRHTVDRGQLTLPSLELTHRKTVILQDICLLTRSTSIQAIFLRFWRKNHVPHRRGRGHIVFGADPVGVGVSVGVTLSCLHDIS